MALRDMTLDDLTIDDESSFRHVALYAELKAALRESGHRFRVPGEGDPTSWDRALFLNLTYWSDRDESSVLCVDHIAPDVIAHTAWHHVAAGHLARLSETAAPAASSAATMFFCEAIASAFDLYLVGRLIGNAPDSEFITSQVPVMAEAAEQAGLPEAGFAALLDAVAANPERAFEDMRALLVDATEALFVCGDVRTAQAALGRFAGHRFEPLLHHFQLSNWILYARAYARVPEGDLVTSDRAVRGVDRILRAAPVSLDWLATNWLGDTSRASPPRL